MPTIFYDFFLHLIEGNKKGGGGRGMGCQIDTLQPTKPANLPPLPQNSRPALHCTVTRAALQSTTSLQACLQEVQFFELNKVTRLMTDSPPTNSITLHHLHFPTLDGSNLVTNPAVLNMFRN